MKIAKRGRPDRTDSVIAIADGAATAAAAALTLDDLSDVTITTPSDNDVLTYDSGTWVNAPPAAGSEATVEHGDLGASETFDLGDGTWHSGTLSADCTITVTGYSVDAQGAMTVKLVQDGTGGWAVTWDADIVWIGDSAPGQSPGDVTLYVITSDEGDAGLYGVRVGGLPPTEITDIPTAETDDSLVLAPDGAGGVEWRAEVGGTGIPTGTSMPGGPSTNDLIFRTDLGLIFYYDGTRWLSLDIFSYHFSTAVAGTSVALVVSYYPPRASVDLWIVDFRWAYNVASNHTASHYWVCELHKYDNATDSVISTLTSDQSTTTYNNPAPTAVGALLGTTNTIMFGKLDKTGSPGTLIATAEARYRIVGT